MNQQHIATLKLISDGIQSPTDEGAKRWIDMFGYSIPHESKWATTYPSDKSYKDLIEGSDAFKKMMECVRAGMPGIDVSWMVVVQFLMYENEEFKAKCSSKMFEDSDDTILSLAVDRVIRSDSDEVKCVAMNTVCCSVIECSRRKSSSHGLEENRACLSARKDLLSSMCDYFACEMLRTSAIDCIAEILKFNAVALVGLGLVDKIAPFLDPERISVTMSSGLTLLIILMKHSPEETLDAVFKNETLINHVDALTNLTSKRKNVCAIKKRAKYLTQAFKAREKKMNLEAAKAMTSIKGQEGAAICPIIIDHFDFHSEDDDEITPMSIASPSGNKRMLEELTGRIAILEQEKKDMQDRHNEKTRSMEAKLEETGQLLAEVRNRLTLRNAMAAGLLAGEASAPALPLYIDQPAVT